MRWISCAALVAATIAVAPSAAAATVTDGQWVLVDQQPLGHRLVTINPPADGGDPAPRTLHTAPSGVALTGPQWSPDGNRIVFAEGNRILLFDLPAARVSEVAPEGSAPAWSPDGTRIAFVRGGALLTRAPDGTGEQVLPIDATGVRDVAWSPDGATFALWLGERLDVVGSDGGAREVFDDHARGGAAFAPDGGSLVYPRYLEDIDGVTLWEVTEDDEGPVGLLGAPADPEFSPSGTALVYTRTDARTGDREIAWEDSRGPATLSSDGRRPAQVDWQPCVAGVTVSCRSTLPPPPVRKLACRTSQLVMNVVAGRELRVPAFCPGASAYDIVTPPAHGTATGGALVNYRAAAGYVGPDTLTYRAVAADGRVSDPIQVNLNVVAPRVKPAAPKLTLASGRLKLDRRGRVTVRGTCDRACVVRLRVRVKLTSGRVVNGRFVRARAAAGGQVKLVLKRGKLPPRRKVAWMRVSGTAVGTDGRERAVKLTLR